MIKAGGIEVLELLVPPDEEEAEVDFSAMGGFFKSELARAKSPGL
jgi:hypothetical protein